MLLFLLIILLLRNASERSRLNAQECRHKQLKWFAACESLRVQPSSAHPVIHERKEAAGSTQMGNAEETNELTGKTGSGKTLEGVEEEVAAVGRSREAPWVRDL